MIAIGLSGRSEIPVCITTKGSELFLTKEQAIFIAEQLDAVIEFVKKHESEGKPECQI